MTRADGQRAWLKSWTGCEMNSHKMETDAQEGEELRIMTRTVKYGEIEGATLHNGQDEKKWPNVDKSEIWV